MSISRRHLAEMIAERTLHVRDEKLLAKEIAAYLLTENRTADFSSLIRDIMRLRAERGLVEATVVSAHGLSAGVKSELKQLIKHEFPHVKEVTLHEAVDPAVVGGLRLDMPEEQLDLTVRTKLAKFKRLTSEGTPS